MRPHARLAVEADRAVDEGRALVHPGDPGRLRGLARVESQPVILHREEEGASRSYSPMGTCPARAGRPVDPGRPRGLARVEPQPVTPHRGEGGASRSYSSMDTCSACAWRRMVVM